MAYRAENAPPWNVEPQPGRPKVDVPVRAVRPAKESAPYTDKDLSHPVPSSSGVTLAELIADAHAPTLKDKEVQVADTERVPNTIAQEAVEAAVQEAARGQHDEGFDTTNEQVEQRHEDMNDPANRIDLLANNGAGLKPVKYNPKEKSVLFKGRKKTGVISGKKLLPRVPTGYMTVSSRKEDNYLTTAYGGGIKENDLTASLHPGIFTDFEDEERLSHAREMIHAINKMEDAANSDKPVSPDDGSKKSSKRKAA
jgi:hypothetical protein